MPDLTLPWGDDTPKCQYGTCTRKATRRVVEHPLTGRIANGKLVLGSDGEIERETFTWVVCQRCAKRLTNDSWSTGTDVETYPLEGALA